MKRYLTIMLAAAGACALQAQSTEVKQGYNGIKNNLLKMAEKMPDENYAFKASPDIRNFGQLVGHVADSTMGTCSAINGEPIRSETPRQRQREVERAEQKAEEMGL